MAKLKYINWQDKQMMLGYLEDYPDYMTQAESIDELEDNLIKTSHANHPLRAQSCQASGLLKRTDLIRVPICF